LEFLLKIDYRNVTVKSSKKIFEQKAKISPENFLLLTRNRQKTEMISLTYDVNDHVYSKSNSFLLCTDLANI